jgi:tRNA/tmRNA/rRNA uracil-C5-methylase (TrmA/RlmC/RlmD family)
MDITIEKLIYGGDGLAHHEGSTVFVPFVLPAERVSAAPVEQKKKFIRARVERLIEPSAGRAVPPCPYFGVCGGCNYQHIAYEAQLQYKTEILRETLRRLGHIEWRNRIVRWASVGLSESRPVESPRARARRRESKRDCRFRPIGSDEPSHWILWRKLHHASPR